MNPAHTAFASAAIDAAQIFELFVSTTPVAAIAGQPYAVTLTKPDGPSTGGGVQKLQHITFTRGTRTFVVGTVDTVEKTLELRGRANLDAMHRERFKEPLPIAPAEYDAFVKRVRSFAGNQHLTIVIKELAAAPVVEASGGGWWKVILGLLLVAGAAVGAFFLLRYYGYA